MCERGEKMKYERKYSKAEYRALLTSEQREKLDVIMRRNLITSVREAIGFCVDVFYAEHVEEDDFENA